MDALDLTKDLLKTALQLGDSANQLTADDTLMGSFAEFNSLSVVSIITGIEEQLGCEVSDMEISEDIFETVGTLADFIATKME